MRNIYIVISQTGTILSRIIKFVTKKDYNHVSISFDKNIYDMYSFGRVNPYNPFVGKYICEHPNYGTYLRFKNTKCIILEVKVTNKQYNKAQNLINKMCMDKNIYKYNVLGLIFAAFNKNYKQYNKFYCSEFVKYVLEYSNINLDNIPKIAHPLDFIKLSNSCVVYNGLLNQCNI